MTLIELMFAMGIAAMISFAGYAFYEHSFKFQSLHERQKDMQVRLQVAMDILVREVRHAGYGIMNPMENALDKGMNACAGVLEGVSQANPALCTVVNPIDGGDKGSDSLGIMQVGDQLVGTLNTPTLRTGNQIVLNRTGMTNALGLITVGGLFAAQVTSVTEAGSVSTLTLNRNVDQSYPVGLPVHSLSALAPVVYSTGIPAGETEPALLRNGALFASGIEDLQVAYLLATATPAGAWVIHNPLTVEPNDLATAKDAYLAIRVSLIARERDPDRNWKGGSQPALENRLMGAADNYRRVVLTRVMELKNDGCHSRDTVC